MTEADRPRRAIGMGCMRLSTAAAADEATEAHAVEVICAGLSAGVTLLDTANVYCHDPRDLGHNERLVARAVREWGGDRGVITVATKGGLTRPGGRWVPDGKGKSLRAACEASLVALGVDAIDLYLLHAPDPKVPLSTSVRALAKLHSEGLARAVGVCNVNATQLALACDLAPIAAVQVELSWKRTAHLRSGVAAMCRERGITLFAHSPLGGPKRASSLGKDRVLAKMAAAEDVSAHELALAWLADLDASVVPIPGPTRVETARRAAAAQGRQLADDIRAQLDAANPDGARFRQPVAERRPGPNAPTRVVMFSGSPAAGKSTAVAPWVEGGSVRLNRDNRGGSLDALAAELERQLAAAPDTHFVLDNTYADRASRNGVLEAAWSAGAHAACRHVDTSLEDAQINACIRMIERHGQLLSPDEIRAAGKTDPNTFRPNVLFDYRRDAEPPSADEGFASVETIEFARRWPDSFTGRALIVEYDGVLRRSLAGHRAPRTPEDIELIDGRAGVLSRYRDDGWQLLGLSWQPDVEGGALTDDQVARLFRRTHDLLGVDIDVRYCPHAAGPPRCWCRKPLPGLGVAHILAHDLDPASCVFVGRNRTDRTFATRLGFEYRDADEFFADPGA